MTLLFLVQPSRQSPSLEAFPTTTEASSNQSRPHISYFAVGVFNPGCLSNASLCQMGSVHRGVQKSKV